MTSKWILGRWKVTGSKGALLREGGALSSAEAGRLPAGSVVDVLEFMEMEEGGIVRARVSQGWFTAAKNGEDLVVLVQADSAPLAASDPPAETAAAPVPAEPRAPQPTVQPPDKQTTQRKNGKQSSSKQPSSKGSGGRKNRGSVDTPSSPASASLAPETEAAGGAEATGGDLEEVLSVKLLNDDIDKGATIMRSKLAKLPPLIERTRGRLGESEAKVGQLSVEGQTVEGQLAELLYRRKVKVVDLLRVYGKDGKAQPGTGTVSRGDFRQSVKKLVNESALDADINALFDSLVIEDEGEGGKRADGKGRNEVGKEAAMKKQLHRLIERAANAEAQIKKEKDANAFLAKRLAQAEEALLFAQEAERQEVELQRLKSGDRPIDERLGTLLMREVGWKKIVKDWSKTKDGGVAVVHKPEFRAGVRKLKLVGEPKAIDALFETCGKMVAGHIEMPEMTKTLAELEAKAREAAAKLAELEASSTDLQRLLLSRAHLSAEIVLTAEAADLEEARLTSLRDSQKTEAQLGKLLVKANVPEHIKGWDQSGSGDVQRAEFRLGVRNLGWKADLADMDKTFETIDTDGDGSITMTELQSALERLRATYTAESVVITEAEKTVTQLQKRTKGAKDLLKTLQPIDVPKLAE